MEEDKTILEAISTLECILFYAKGGNKLRPELEEMHKEIKKMLYRWHFLTGEML